MEKDNLFKLLLYVSRSALSPRRPLRRSSFYGHKTELAGLQFGLSAPQGSPEHIRRGNIEINLTCGKRLA